MCASVLALSSVPDWNRTTTRPAAASRSSSVCTVLSTGRCTLRPPRSSVTSSVSGAEAGAALIVRVAVAFNAGATITVVVAVGEAVTVAVAVTDAVAVRGGAGATVTIADAVGVCVRVAVDQASGVVEGATLTVKPVPVRVTSGDGDWMVTGTNVAVGVRTAE